MRSQLCAEHNSALQVLVGEKLHMPDMSEKSVQAWHTKLEPWGATVSDVLDASVTSLVVRAYTHEVDLFIATSAHAAPNVKGV